MKLINQLRKYVHSIIFVNKLKNSKQELNAEFGVLSLREFINNYDYAYSSLKGFVYDCNNHL